MKLAVICTGDELLKGSIQNSNLAFLGSVLLENGIVPELSLEVKDTPSDIGFALSAAFSRADTVIMTGGLGPTADDVTKESAAAFFGRTLAEDGPAAAALQRAWNSLKRGDIPSRFLNQAMVPEGSETIPNRFGTAPGVRISDEKHGTLYMLPGPPAEMEPMFAKQVLPELLEKLDRRVHSCLLYVAGVPESLVEERMLPVIGPGVNVAYCASPGLVKLFLSGTDPELVGAKVARAKEIFRDELLSPGVAHPAGEAVRLLRRRGFTLATAESCTGGWIAKEITAVPGASDVFKGGVVSYANELKHEFLGVSEETLSSCGAVSAECCTEMLNGICGRAKTECGIAVTGIAGPGGGTIEKPVGLVFIGAKAGDKFEITENHFRGGRDQVRAHSVARGLNLLNRLLKQQ